MSKSYQMTYGSDISQCIKIDKIIAEFITLLIKVEKKNQQLTFYLMLMYFGLTKTFFRMMLSSDLSSLISDLDTLIGPHHYKTCLRAFRQSSFQTRLLSYTD